MTIIDASLAIPRTQVVRKRNIKKSEHSFGEIVVCECNDAKDTQVVNTVNSLLFLQEIDDYSKDKAKLVEYGDKIIESLNCLRFDLLSGRLSEESIRRLKALIDSKQPQFQFEDIQNVINEIRLRLEIELAKIEVNHY